MSCETVENKGANGKIFYSCKCKDLSLTTIVNDVEFIFGNSKLGDVFSDQGLEYKHKLILV